MKKFLLSCFVALGIGASAQYNYVGDFESNYTTAIYKQFGGGSRVAAAACNGGFGGQLAISGSFPETGFLIDLAQIGQTGNGQALTVSANYKKAATVTGTISLAYYILDPVSNLWTVTPFGTAVNLTAPAVTTCAALTGTIPSGAIQPGATAGIGVWFERSGSTSGNIFVDDITFAQATATTVPACTTIINPVDNSTVAGGNMVLSWTPVATAVNYKVTIGTTAGGSDVFNATVAGASANISVPVNSTLYANVIPTNNIGDATGCTGITFTTNSTVSYCAVGADDPTITYPIQSVTFNGQTNTSSATVGSPAYEDFTSVVFDAIAGSAVPFTIKGTGLGTNRFGATLFVDWNNNGSFNDAGEQYFTTSEFIGGTGNPVTLSGNLTVPATVAAGQKRVRIKYNFNSSTTSVNTALSNPCENMGNGQAEDYTLNVTIPTVVPACATITAPTNGSANVPFGPVTVTWNAVSGAQGYKVYMGTTAGGTDIANGTVISNTTFTTPGALSTTYFVKIVPFNVIGDAAGCTEISFTTAAFNYCTSGATNTNYEKIASVIFANINNPSSSTAGYEDFTGIIGTVNKQSTYPMTVNISGFDNDNTIVWIDYNQNGLFDANESTTLTKAAASTGSITIPATALEGKTRMRIVMRFSTAPTACGTYSYGQTEDYTLDIKPAITAAVNQVDKNAVSVYPNPFRDVLKISDVKGVKSIMVSDIAGRKVKTLAPAADLNLSDLGAGVYVLTLQMEDGSVKSHKVIKK